MSTSSLVWGMGNRNTYLAMTLLRNTGENMALSKSNCLFNQKLLIYLFHPENMLWVLKACTFMRNIYLEHRESPIFQNNHLHEVGLLCRSTEHTDRRHL